MIKKKQLLFGLLAIALACPLTAMAQPLATPSHSYTTNGKLWAPFPKAGDKYWRKQVPEAMRKDYIRLGDSCVNMPWEAIPDKVFA